MDEWNPLKTYLGRPKDYTGVQGGPRKTKTVMRNVAFLLATVVVVGLSAGLAHASTQVTVLGSTTVPIKHDNLRLVRVRKVHDLVGDQTQDVVIDALEAKVAVLTPLLSFPSNLALAPLLSPPHITRHNSLGNLRTFQVCEGHLNERTPIHGDSQNGMRLDGRRTRILERYMEIEVISFPAQSRSSYHARVFSSAGRKNFSLCQVPHSRGSSKCDAGREEKPVSGVSSRTAKRQRLRPLRGLLLGSCPSNKNSVTPNVSVLGS